MTTNEAIKSFTQTKADARKANNHLSLYNRGIYDGHTLRDVYGNFSIYKERAFNYCVELMNALNGRGLVIMSHSSQVFSVGFLFTHPETGRDCFAYITRDYNRFCEIQ